MCLYRIEIKKGHVPVGLRLKGQCPYRIERKTGNVPIKFMENKGRSQIGLNRKKGRVPIGLTRFRRSHDLICLPTHYVQT